MEKTLVKTLAIISIVFCIIILYELLSPIKETTTAINVESNFLESYEKEFILYYHAPYKIYLEFQYDVEKFCEYELDVKFTKNQETLLDTILEVKSKFAKINKQFVGGAYDDCLLIIRNTEENSNNKKVKVLVDVLNGAPSVGIAFRKAMRPYLWIVFVLIFICSLITTYFGFIINEPPINNM